jgi:hypothetical protein
MHGSGKAMLGMKLIQGTSLDVLVIVFAHEVQITET